MGHQIDLVVGDTGSVLKATCTDKDTGIVLPGLGASVVRLKYRINNDNLKTKTMQVVDAAAGKVEYQFASGDLSSAGSFRGEIEVTDAANKVLTNIEPIVLMIRGKI